MPNLLKDVFKLDTLRSQSVFLASAPMAAGVALMALLVPATTKTALAAAVIIALLYAVQRHFIMRLIVEPVEALSSAMKAAADDLTVQAPVATDNELGELAKWFNTHVGSLNQTMTRLNNTVRALGGYTGSISSAVSQQATVSAEQSASVAEITSTSEELSISASQIAEHAKSVVDIANRTWEDTKKGAVAIETVLMKMNDINMDNQSNIEEIIELGKKSREISRVMEIINAIADQTKLIAFNAALEAASAGDAGRRFGVVAAEIRRLADNVMASTSEIEGKVNEIQFAIDRLVISSEKGSKSIQEGVEYSGETAMILSNVVEAAQSTTNAAKQISLSTQQQKTASSQVVVALREIVMGAGHTANSIKDIGSISGEMATLSSDLMGVVGQYRLEKN